MVARREDPEAGALMAINTKDREHLRRNVVTITRHANGNISAKCPCCPFPGGRTFGTEAGAVTRMAEHMPRAHGIRLELRRSVL